MVDESTATQQPPVAETPPVMKVIECPNCKNMVPSSLFCVACQFPIFSVENQEETSPLSSEDIASPDSDPLRFEKEHSESSEIPVTSIIEDFNLDSNLGLPTKKEEEWEPISISEEEEILEREINEPGNEIRDSDQKLQAFENNLGIVEDGLEPKNTNTSIQELIKNIVNCISLKLWSINQLLENKIEEEQFVKMYSAYKDRYKKLVDQRSEWIEKVNDLASLEQTLKESIVALEELKMRRSLNDLLEGEFEVMAPAHEWKINSIQSRMSEKMKDLESLRILSLTISQEKIMEVKETIRRISQSIIEIEGTEKLSFKTVERVTDSLDEIQSFLDNQQD